MSKRSEDSLERFFRKAVKQYDKTFLESDWQKMEKMLDEKAMEEAAIQTRNFRLIIVSVAILLLLTGGIYFSRFNPTVSGNNDIKTQTQAATGAETSGDGATQISPDAGLRSSSEQKSDIPITSPDKSESKVEAVTDQVDGRSVTEKDQNRKNITDESGANVSAGAAEALSSDNGNEKDKVLSKNEKPIGMNSVNEQRHATDPKQIALESVKQEVGDNSQTANKKSVLSSAADQNKKKVADVADANMLTGAAAVLAADKGNEKGEVILRNDEAAGVNEMKAQHEATNSKQIALENTKQDVGDETKTAKNDIYSISGGDNNNNGNDLSKSTSGATGVMPGEGNSQNGPAATANETQSADSLAAMKMVARDTLPEVASKVEEEKQEKIAVFPSRWSVALSVAPDFTSSALGKYTSPGEAFGLLVSYRVFNRFSVNTGIFRSTKKYTGKGSDYSPPPGYWARKTNGIIPDEINGNCLVYEIPLIIQYDLLQRERSRTYLSGGVSSYIMTTQHYQYTFSQENPGADRGWATSEAERYPFNIAHFSLGYEWYFIPKVSVGLEPYLKIPFTGMGWSDVDLFSTGIFINVRYRFFKKEVVEGNKN